MTARHDSLVVDTSAIIACCLGEPGYEKLEAILTSGAHLLMSAPTRLELGIVAMQRNIEAKVVQALQTYQTQIEAFTEAHSLVALVACARYGKGRHPAALNFGDCCAYALAKSMNLPLLYKGNHFAQTDIASAMSVGTA